MIVPGNSKLPTVWMCFLAGEILKQLRLPISSCSVDHRLTEREAKLEKIPYLAASYPFNDHGKSMIMEALDGFVKLLANPETGEILGGTCVGPVGGELIHEIVAAMSKRMTVHELAAMPHYHPTLAEIWTYPAEELADQIRV